jgi:hypothetical protein
MTTNINLSSPEVSEKKSITGKSALVFSALILALVFGLYFGLLFLKARYSAEDKNVSEKITQEQDKVSGTTFADILNFQEKLDLADKAVGDHSYWDGMLKKMSAYIIPEVKLTQLSGKIDAGGTGVIEISGIAPNLDALSRELILLKDFPDLDSMEFKNAGESQGQANQQSGIIFDADLKINKAAFQK